MNKADSIPAWADKRKKSDGVGYLIYPGVPVFHTFFREYCISGDHHSRRDFYSMRKKRFLALVTALALAAGMAACGGNGGNTSSAGNDASAAPAADSSSAADAGSDAPAADNPATPAGGAGIYPGTPDPDTIVIDNAQEPPDLVPFTTTTTGSGNVLRETLFGLVELDEGDMPVPAVAESWESAANAEGVENMVWTFHLRNDFKWTVTGAEYADLNGTPVTAHDFIYAWTKALTPSVGAQYNYMCYIFKNGEKFFNGECGIEEVGFKAVDDYTIEIELENPLSYLLSQLTFYIFKPVNQKIYETIGEDKYNREAASFAANGPYKMTEWVHEDHILLEANENYPDVANVKVPKVKIVSIADSNTKLNGFRAGEIDMIGLNAEQVAMLEAEGQPIQHYNDGSTWYMQYNTTRQGLGSPKIRKALTMAINRESFIKDVIKNNSTVADYFTSSAINGVDGPFVDVLKAEGITFEYDPEAAKALFEEGLAEAGLASVEEFNALGYSITTDTGDTALRDCQFYQEQWKTNLGVEVGINQMTYQARVEATHQGEYDISLFGWGPDYNDPMTFLDLWVTGGGNNDSRYSNSEYDELIAKARAEADPKVREGYFVECERILNRDMPCGPIYNRYRDYVVSDKTSGLWRTTFQDFNLNHMEILG